MRRYLALTLVLLVNHNGPDPYTDEVMRGIARGDPLTRGPSIWNERERGVPRLPRYVPPPPVPPRYYGPERYRDHNQRR